MKKYFLITLAIAIAFVNASAQKSVEIKKGEVIIRNLCIDNKYIGKDESGYYVEEECKERGIYLTKSDLNLNRIKEEQLILSKDNVYKDKFFIASRYFNNKLYAFSSSQIEQKGQVISTLFAETFDKNTLQPNGDAVVLDTVTTEKKIKKKSTYHLVQSSDSSKFLIAYRLPMEDKEGILVYRFMLCDKDFKLLWKKEKPLGYSIDNFFIEEFDASNEGTFALTCNLKSESDMPNDKHLLVLTNNATQLKDYLLKPEGKSPSSVKTRFDKNGHIVCSGLYTEKGWQYGKGWYLMRINPQTKEVMYTKTGAFDKNFIVNPTGNKIIDKIKCIDTKDSSPELERYEPKVLEFADNGDVILILEQDYKTLYEEYLDREGKRQKHYTFYLNDIVAISFSADGKLNWIKRIPKMQKIVFSDSFGSFAYAFINNKLHFLFNGYPAAKKVKPDESLLFSKKNLITVYHVTMDLSGNFTTEELYTTVENDFNMRISDALQISGNEILLHGVLYDMAERKLMKFRFQ